MLDDADRRLLRYLQDDPDQTIANLAEVARLPQATAARRVERMRSEGIIRATRAVIDWAALGYEIEVSLRVTLDKTDPRAFDTFLEAARKVPEVVELQTFLGRVDVRLSIIARNMVEYQALYRTSILALPHIADIEALMQIAPVSERAGLPL